METRNTNQQAGGLFEILQKIRVRPGMYIGKPSVSDLFMFLVGYKTARRELGIELTEQEEEFCSEFQPWLQQKFQVPTVRSWAQIILMNTTNEAEGFASFFQLLDEFLNRKKVSTQVQQALPLTSVKE
jgi:hypothetical protein